MATQAGHRVAAFLLALLFLLTTIGTTAYIIWQINQGDGGLVDDTTTQTAAEEEPQQQCGEVQPAAVSPRPIPSVTTAPTPVTDLETVDIIVGSGDTVQAADCVTVLYYGTIAESGTVFDGNYTSGQPAELSLLRVIEGWQKGIPGMKVGGTRRLVIPAAQAYGDQGSCREYDTSDQTKCLSYTIEPGQDLVFEVEVLATKRGTN